MTDWRSEKLKDKPTTTTNNDFLDDIYATASPYESRSIFKIAFFTDFDVDLNYHEGTPHINCYDDNCCHDASPEVQSDTDRAPTYGSQNCYLPIAGYKKMIDKINELNVTKDFSFASIIYGGSSVADLPEYTTEA